jgi:hypothetical protein
LAQRAAPAVQTGSERETASSERAFLRELMFNNPKAFQSDLGPMAMATRYPQHFQVSQLATETSPVAGKFGYGTAPAIIAAEIWPGTGH